MVAVKFNESSPGSGADAVYMVDDTYSAGRHGTGLWTPCVIAVCLGFVAAEAPIVRWSRDDGSGPVCGRSAVDSPTRRPSLTPPLPRMLEFQSARPAGFHDFFVPGDIVEVRANGALLEVWHTGGCFVSWESWE